MMPCCADKVLVLNILIIMSEVKCGTNAITFTAPEGGKVEIHCPYKSGYEEHEKYLCRGKCQPLSKDIPVKSESKPDDVRFSLTDNSTAHIFTVTITDLRLSDEGTYWCSIKTGFGRNDDYTEVHLKMTQDNRSSVSRITTATKTTTISSTQPGSPHYTVNTDTMASSSPSSLSRFYPGPTNLKTDMTAIISLSVMLTLLFGLSLFMYCTRRNKTRDSSLINNDTLQENAENNIYVITGIEGLRDVIDHQDGCTCSSCVHVNSHPPTNSSETDTTIYSLVQFHTKPLA
ncbi:CMRF35-like molecule 5 [Triplophysa dalaica]|uniref:CMRF35-like molecule 5 n=1 Tax=Triplophysa dalaica TaxID=1582913 RepID=UPI0024DFADD0|nr:CMRF35-like molecule 5 [Triplophysa dalaica]